MKRDNWYRHVRRDLQTKWDAVDKDDLTPEQRLKAFEKFILDELAMTKHMAIDNEFRIHPQNSIL